MSSFRKWQRSASFSSLLDLKPGINAFGRVSQNILWHSSQFDMPSRKIPKASTRCHTQPRHGTCVKSLIGCLGNLMNVCVYAKYLDIYMFWLQLWSQWSHVVCLSEEMVTHWTPTMRGLISGHPYFTASSAALPQNMECSFASHCKACRLKRFVNC